MNRLTIKLLGPPEVSYEDQPLTFRSRKVLALLIYLVAEGELQSREKLSAMLWPTSSHERGMASLRNTLARLKQALAPAGQFLLTGRGMVGFDFAQPLDLDLRLLETAVLPGAVEKTLQSALAVQRGPFLAGFSLADAPEFDEWVTMQRRFWEQRWETVFDNLSQRQLAEGKSHAAIEAAARWLAETPYNEIAARRLMKAYALAGDRVAALRVYEQCRQILKKELDIEPAPETVELAQRIAHTGAASSAGSGARPRPSRVPAGSSRGGLIVPLVGRSRELERLRDRYQQAPHAGAQVVAVTGEAGLGKTQLVETFLNWAALERADIVRGRAFEMGGHLPYQPLIDGLRIRLDQENAPDDLLEDVWLSELSQLLPELRGRYPDLAPPMAGNAEFVRGRLFEAVANLGLALAERRPVILFVDDMQWADTGTREMLHYLAQRWTAARQPIMLLLTVRQEGLLTQPALRDWVTSLSRDTALAQLRLAPLTAADLQQLAGRLADGGRATEAQARQFGAWLKSETNGSPFFVNELLQMLVEQEVMVGEIGDDGRLRPDLATTMEQIAAIERVPLPPNVRDVVLARINRLSKNGRTLLLVGAVIGRECSFERLCQLAGLDGFAGLPALEELLDGRLMLETENEDRPFTFAHDNIRDVVYTEAGATRRRLYHRQLYSLLEEEGAPAAELAFQAIAARLKDGAFRYSLAAGDDALQLNAFVEAVGHYNRALDFMVEVEASSEKICALYSQRGRALELCGHYAVALENYQALLELARQMGDPTLELAALVAEGTIRATANEFSDFVLGEKLGEQALALARELDDKAAEARIQWNMLNVYRMTERNDEALRAGVRSLALAEELGLREEMAYAANDLVYIYMAQGDIASTLATGERAIALWRELGNQPMLTDSLINYANMQVMIGSYETAVTIASEALQISRALENQWAESFSLYTYSMVYQQRLVVDKALEVMAESVCVGEAAGFVGAQVLIRVFEAQLRLDLGDVAQARRLVETAVAVARRRIPLFSPAAQGVLAQVAVQEGDLAAAEAFLDAGDHWEFVPNLMNFLTPETAVCCYALEAGRHEDAYAFSARVLAYLREQNLRMYIPDFCYFQGRALVGLQRAAEARGVLEEGLTLLRDTGGRRHFGEIAGLLASLEEQKGDKDKAEALREEARTVLDFVIEHISDEGIRAFFLALPAVRALVS